MTRGLYPWRILVCSLTPLAWGQSPAIQSLEAKDAYKLLNTALNDKRKKVPAYQLPTTPWNYGGVRRQYCFGLRLPGGERVAGASPGWYERGVTFFNPEGQRGRLIGALLLETAMTLQDRPLHKGIYLVAAFPGNLGMFGDFASDISAIPLPSEIEAALLEERASPGLKFSLVNEGDQIFMVVGANKLPLKVAQTPQQ